jgi:hypothetical protein
MVALQESANATRLLPALMIAPFQMSESPVAAISWNVVLKTAAVALEGVEL